MTFLLVAANYDPDVFADPQTFDLLRTPNRHLAFGKGRHHCLGAAMARIELRILFEELVARVRASACLGEFTRAGSPHAHVEAVLGGAA